MERDSCCMQPRDYVDPIDVHLATNGPPVLREEARERISVAHGVEPDSEWDEEFDDEMADESVIEVANLDAAIDAVAHVVLHSTSEGSGAKCEHCGATLLHSMPVKLSDWCHYGKSFVVRHANCEPPQKKKAATKSTKGKKS